MTATILSGRSLSRDLATGILGSAVFGVAAAAGHSPRSMLQGAWVAPALFVGGAALATPPLYLLGALSGGRTSVAGTLASTSRSLAAASTALLGLSAPALYLSVTMRTDTGQGVLLLASVVVGAAGIAAVLRERLQAERTDAARLAAVAWCAFALMLGARLISSLGRTAGMFGGA
jgi:hypothetical protein